MARLVFENINAMCDAPSCAATVGVGSGTMIGKVGNLQDCVAGVGRNSSCGVFTYIPNSGECW
jgi:hypothetical protein